MSHKELTSVLPPQDFDKDYDDVEKQARFGAFADNYEYIQRENSKGHSYKLGLNEFSDMTLDEFKMNRLYPYITITFFISCSTSLPLESPSFQCKQKIT